MIYREIIKPLIDRISAFILLVLSLPAWIIIIPVLLISNNGKVFFTQVRPGYKGKLFRMYKFKTMNDRVDRNNQLLPDLERMHPAGRFIRKTSMDELPQLLNVLKGEMSIVGPRPLLKEYLELYTDHQKQRHNVMPGITGWAQVNGRNAISWQQKFDLDVWYAEHQGFILDLKILFLTLLKVIKREGVNQSATDTMSPFTGNHE